MYVTNIDIPEIRNLSILSLSNYYPKFSYVMKISTFSYQMNSHQIFNHDLFKVFLSFIDSYYFTLILLPRCFIFREIHGKDSDKYPKIEVSDNFKIIKLNCLVITRSNEKN